MADANLRIDHLYRHSRRIRLLARTGQILRECLTDWSGGKASLQIMARMVGAQDDTSNVIAKCCIGGRELVERAEEMSHCDMRQWIARLEEEGELKRIAVEVDWEEELGGIARASLALCGPALLFENIKDHQATRCRKLFTNGLGTYGRIALALGLPKSSSIRDMIQHCRERLRKRIPPVLVASGPVKENIVKSDAVNLYEFPVPKWHGLDGGRYIDTCCGVVTKDPDTGQPNVGLYRGMIVDANKIGKLLVPIQHWGQHFIKYQARGEPMPIAIVYGWDDLLPVVAAAPLSYHLCEWDVLGSLRDAPVELIKCETVDLEVPAAAEIVVEGSVSTDPAAYELEGPFGDFTGYFGGAKSLKPVAEIRCIVHRNDPILRGLVEGTRPGMPNENGYFYSISLSAIAWNILENAGVPGVTDVFCLPVTVGTTVYVQIHKTYRGQAKQVAAALWGSGAAQWYFKNVIVVEEDIDIHSRDDIEWALAYRVNAGENDIITLPGSFGSLLDPSTRIEEKDALKYGSGKWCRMLIDATMNWEYQRRPEWNNQVYPPLNRLAPGVERLIASRWEEYNLGLPYLNAEQRERLTLEKTAVKFPAIG